MKKKGKVSAKATETILESISDGVFTVNHKWRITSFNRAAEEITGIPREEAIGRYCWEVFRSNMCEEDCALKRTMKVGKSFVSTSTYIINSDKQRIPIAVSTSLLKVKQGKSLEALKHFAIIPLLRSCVVNSVAISARVIWSVAVNQCRKYLHFCRRLQRVTALCS